MLRKNKVSLVLLLLSVGMISLGVLRGEVETVLDKAIHLCLECVGIG